MPLSHLAHDRAGSGEPVVLIHGIGHRRQAWKPVFDRLAEHHDVIVLDLAGFGESAPYPSGERYDMDNACSDLADNFARWGIERPHVVGNSLGGAISLELASRELVSSATVLSPAGFFGRFDRYWALTSLLAMWGSAHVPDALLRTLSRSAAARRAIGYLLYAHPEVHGAEATYGDALAMKRARAFLPTLRAGLSYELENGEGRLGATAPVTVAWGTLDRLLPYSQAATAERRLPQARHVALPGCGHVPMSDDPALIVAVVEETIARAAEQRAA
ncbi:alpha/beta hydrolase [Nocardioides sp.]|jgi:pimeloyl-ACP methyl ester carboxylesterase|uniref:alpha/beta fold hydrolase n=1 Tax=Nocardioides sp. TaxID=35761 RepID=UPI00261E3DF7|nr:alpha/beta hydrolase [Nocardioides sp.]